MCRKQTLRQKSRQSPQRTCVGCQQVEDKRQLIRLVRTLEGAVNIDETGKHPGRGAYLHRCQYCWKAALQKRRLEHALRLRDPLSRENLDILEAYAETLPEKLDFSHTQET